MDPLWAALLDAVGKLGATGLALFLVWLFITGRIRVGSLVDKEIERITNAYEKRILELGLERDEWRGRDHESAQRLSRLADAFTRITRRKAPD